MYRPTVRYAEIFRDYVDELFKATHLDRNQIIRAALFAAAHSKEFHSMLEKYKKDDVTLPQADWGLDEEDCWKNQNYIQKPKTEELRNGEPIVRIIKSGGIKYVPKSSSPPSLSVTL